jgi:hypothetical protein
METVAMFNEFGIYAMALVTLLALGMIIREFIIPKEKRALRGVMFFALIVALLAMWYGANFMPLPSESFWAELLTTNWP